jgi:RNA polymerase sigma-70 factor (ECF subfamily)
MLDPIKPLAVADPDLDLMRQARDGDFTAFEQLVERLQHRVFGLAYRMLGSQHDAEDVTQQTFLSVVEHLKSFREGSAVVTWVLRIATNHALKLLRKQRGLPTVPLVGNTDPEERYSEVPHPEFIAPWRSDPTDLAEQRETRELIDRALAELDDKYRAVFVLRDVEGFSVKDTAELLGISEANVKVRLLRARLTLRERLTRVFGDEASRVFPDHSHGSSGEKHHE